MTSSSREPRMTIENCPPNTDRFWETNATVDVPMIAPLSHLQPPVATQS